MGTGMDEEIERDPGILNERQRRFLLGENHDENLTEEAERQRLYRIQQKYVHGLRDLY